MLIDDTWFRQYNFSQTSEEKELSELLNFCDSVHSAVDGETSRYEQRGGVPEWPKGSDCKSDVYDFGGSNPPPSTTTIVQFS